MDFNLTTFTITGAMIATAMATLVSYNNNAADQMQKAMKRDGQAKMLAIANANQAALAQAAQMKAASQDRAASMQQFIADMNKQNALAGELKNIDPNTDAETYDATKLALLNATRAVAADQKVLGASGSNPLSGSGGTSGMAPSSAPSVIREPASAGFSDRAVDETPRGASERAI